VEEARQHSALIALQRISLFLFGMSLLVLLIIIFGKITKLGNVLVVLVALALVARTAFYGVAFTTVRSTGKSGTAYALLRASISFALTVGWVLFVLGYQFRNVL
jgi:hypothetical protein